jgi:hypothetical protein
MSAACGIFELNPLPSTQCILRRFLDGMKLAATNKLYIFYIMSWMKLSLLPAMQGAIQNAMQRINYAASVAVCSTDVINTTKSPPCNARCYTERHA